jgi:hypothetical protein
MFVESYFTGALGDIEVEQPIIAGSIVHVNRSCGVVVSIQDERMTIVWATNPFDYRQPLIDELTRQLAEEIDRDILRALKNQGYA